MNDIIRLVTTSVIWGTLAIIFTINGPFSGEMVPLAVVLGIGATISTSVIWQNSKSSRNEEAAVQTGKAKRSGRLSQMVERLSDDDIYTLEELLAARHDDPMTDYEERRR